MFFSERAEEAPQKSNKTEKQVKSQK